MTRYIDAHRERFGVEPICQTLQVAPSTYYAAKTRRPSARRVRDAELKREVSRVHGDNFRVYGVEKIWRQLLREGITVGRDRVARLMRDLELAGAVRGKKARTADGERPRSGGWNRIQPIVDDVAREVERLGAAGLKPRDDVVTGPRWISSALCRYCRQPDRAISTRWLVDLD